MKNLIVQRISTIMKKKKMFWKEITASQIGVRLESKFISNNVINLSRRNLSASEVYLLSKDLKVVPTASEADSVKLKTELEEYRRNLRLMWHCRNDERSFAADRYRSKSSFNPRNNDFIIDTYLSCLEEGLLGIEIPSKRFNNLTKEEREVLYSLKDDHCIIIKVLLSLSGSERIIWWRYIDSLMIKKCINKSPTTRVSLLTLWLKH